MPGQPVLTQLADYDALYRQFRWSMPATYNIGVEVCDRWADLDPRRTALIDSHADGHCDEMSYGALRDASNRLANALRAFGVTRGDRVGILLPQGPDVAVSHIAIYKLAAIALPLAMLFGVDAILYRLRNSGAKALITDAQGLAKLADSGKALPDLVLSVDGAGDKALSFHETLARAACPPRADRPSARHRGAARVLSPAWRPHVDASRLGVGWRAAQLPVAGAALWRARGGAALRALRPRGGVCRDGANRRAQHLHPADRAAHDALGARSPRPPRHPPAHGRLWRRGARRRDLRMGQVGARPRHQRVLWPDRMQPRGRLLRRNRRQPAGRHGQTDPGPCGLRDRAGRRAMPGRRNRRDRHQVARPRDVSVLLGQS